MAFGNQYGIDLGQIIGQGNALADSQQRRQINALSLQNAQQQQQDRNALSAAGPQITSEDPAQREMGYKRLSDQPELVMKLRSAAAGQDKERIAAVADATGRAAVGLSALSDEQLAEHWPAAVSALEAKVGHPAVQWRQAQTPQQMRQVLDGSIADAQTVTQALASKEKSREFDSQEADRKATRGDTAAYRKATLNQGAQRIGIEQQKANQASAPSDDATISSYGDNILNGNAQLQNVPTKDRAAVSKYISQQTDAETPLGAQRSTLASSRITAPYTKLPQYELTANGLPYLQRIDAASKHPGAIGDAEMLDSLVKLNTSGNAVTAEQVNLIKDYGSLSDMFSRMTQKLQNGGVLSTQQRKDLQEVAKATYNNYKKGYQPVYDQATSQLKAAGIKEKFWTIPNLNKLSAQALAADQDVPHPNADPAAIAEAKRRGLIK